MRPRTHVIAIAIEDYLDASLPDIGYATRDAEAFTVAWQACGADRSDCQLLVSTAATLTNLQLAVRKVSGIAAEGDRVVMFYAGHALTIDSIDRITTYDTQSTDIDRTSMPLSELLDSFRRLDKCQVILFLEPYHDPLISLPGVNSLDVSALRSFCKESKFRNAFLACKETETSYRSGTQKQGIWTYCIVQAMNGSAKAAVDKEGRLSVASLQAFLQDEVPRMLRVSIAGAVKQSPTMLGSKSKDLILVDFRDLAPSGGSLAVQHTTNPIQDSCLTGEMRGRVKDLKGYSKPKSPLCNHNDWERSFVESAGARDVTEQATSIFELMREAFRYKRKDLSFSNVGPTASIKCPDFDVNISLSQDPDDAERYFIATEVRSFRNPLIVEDVSFLAIFTKYCSRVVFEMAGFLDLEAKIDDIEEIDALAEHLEYDPECTEFTLKLPDAGINIHATEKQIVFALDRHGDLKQLLGNTQKAFAKLAGNRIQLGLTGKSD